MKETELKLHPCYCGGEMGIKKVTQNSGMDGSYVNWELTCKKCGMTMTYAADGFYGRKYKTFEEVVDDWNHNWENKADALDKIKAEIEALPKTYPFINHFDMYVKVSDVEKIIDKYKAESENKSICDSCVAKRCEFQSCITVKHCDFYKAGSEK